MQVIVGQVVRSQCKSTRMNGAGGFGGSASTRTVSCERGVLWKEGAVGHSGKGRGGMGLTADWEKAAVTGIKKQCGEIATLQREPKHFDYSE